MLIIINGSDHVMMLMMNDDDDTLSVVKDVSSSFSVLQRPDFVFMDDYLAEGLLRLCVHLVKASFCLLTVFQSVSRAAIS